MSDTFLSAYKAQFESCFEANNEGFNSARKDAIEQLARTIVEETIEKGSSIVLDLEEDSELWTLAQWAKGYAKYGVRLATREYTTDGDDYMAVGIAEVLGAEPATVYTLTVISI